MKFKVGDRVVNNGLGHTSEWKGQRGRITYLRETYARIRYENPYGSGPRELTTPTRSLDLLTKKLIVLKPRRKHGSNQTEKGS